jgi:hypothetical protein
MAQTEQSWLICDGWKCSKAAKLLVSIDTVHSKCINGKIKKFVNIFASWIFLFLYYTLTFVTIVIDCMEFVYWYCVKCLWFCTIYQESITLSPDLSSFNSGIYTLVIFKDFTLVVYQSLETSTNQSDVSVGSDDRFLNLILW